MDIEPCIHCNIKGNNLRLKVKCFLSIKQKIMKYNIFNRVFWRTQILLEKWKRNRVWRVLSFGSRSYDSKISKNIKSPKKISLLLSNSLVKYLLVGSKHLTLKMLRGKSSVAHFPLFLSLKSTHHYYNGDKKIRQYKPYVFC